MHSIQFPAVRVTFHFPSIPFPFLRLAARNSNISYLNPEGRRWHSGERREVPPHCVVYFIVFLCGSDRITCLPSFYDSLTDSVNGFIIKRCHQNASELFITWILVSIFSYLFDPYLARFPSAHHHLQLQLTSLTLYYSHIIIWY